MAAKHGTFNLAGRFLPRLAPGKPIPAATVNAAAKAGEQVCPSTGPGSGLAINQTGTSMGLRLNRTSHAASFLTTGQITAAGLTSGVLTFGKGPATFQLTKSDGTDLKTSDSGKSETVYNPVSKKIKSGTVVQCVLEDGNWVVFATYDCADLS